MPAQEQTKRALCRLEEVRELIREAEVELRESAYYPPAETSHHLSEAASNLVAADQSLRAVLEILENSSIGTSVGPQPKTHEGTLQEKMNTFPTKILLATDGSEETTLAARTAADIARKTGSELHLVHVAYLLPMSTEASYIAS